MKTAWYIKDAACLYGFMLPINEPTTFDDWANLIGSGCVQNEFFASKVREMKATATRTLNGTIQISHNA